MQGSNKVLNLMGDGIAKLLVKNGQIKARNFLIKFEMAKLGVELELKAITISARWLVMGMFQ